MTAHFERPMVRADGLGETILLLILGMMIGLVIMVSYSTGTILDEVRTAHTAGVPELEVIYSHPRMPTSLSTVDNWTGVTLPDGLMPDFPQCGIDVESWCWKAREGTFKDGHVLEVRLTGDGKVLADVQYMEMSVEYAEMHSIAHLTDTVWLSAVRVARFARLNGLGAKMITAGDRLLAYIVGCEGVACGYHAFFNSSGSQRWMDAMRARVPDALIIYEDMEMFIYEVLSR